VKQVKDSGEKVKATYTLHEKRNPEDCMAMRPPVSVYSSF